MRLESWQSALKRELLRQWVVVVIEQAWVDINPDRTATAHYLPQHPCVEAKLEFDACNFKHQFVLSTLCPAIVYFSGTVYKVEGAETFYRKDAEGGWTDIIIWDD